MAKQLETEPLEQVADELLAMPETVAILDRNPAWRAQLRGQLMRMNDTGVPRAFRAYAIGASPVEDADVLRRVTAPVLVAANGSDPNHPAHVAERLGSLLPNAEVQIYDDDFAMFIDDLDDFAARVASFLRS